MLMATLTDMKAAHRRTGHRGVSELLGEAFSVPPHKYLKPPGLVTHVSHLIEAATGDHWLAFPIATNLNVDGGRYLRFLYIRTYGELVVQTIRSKTVTSLRSSVLSSKAAVLLTAFWPTAIDGLFWRELTPVRDPYIDIPGKYLNISTFGCQVSPIVRAPADVAEVGVGLA